MWSLFGAMAPPRTLLPSSTPAGASSSPSNSSSTTRKVQHPRQLGLKSEKSEILKSVMQQKEMKDWCFCCATIKEGFRHFCPVPRLHLSLGERCALIPGAVPAADFLAVNIFSTAFLLASLFLSSLSFLTLCCWGSGAATPPPCRGGQTRKSQVSSFDADEEKKKMWVHLVCN